jgi:hypothetical protein
MGVWLARVALACLFPECHARRVLRTALPKRPMDDGWASQSSVTLLPPPVLFCLEPVVFNLLSSTCCLQPVVLNRFKKGLKVLRKEFSDAKKAKAKVRLSRHSLGSGRLAALFCATAHPLHTSFTNIY